MSHLFSTIALCMIATVAHADVDIPDEWFFEGANRPKALRNLEGKPAPELTTQAWIGDETSIAASKGKVVVVDFWATWCGPCMNAIPENVKLVSESEGKPLTFIGVHDANLGWNKAPDAVKSKHINYPVAQDKGDSAKAYQVSFWPTYVVIDHEGIVRAAGLIPSNVAKVVELLLAQVPASAPTGESSEDSYFGGGTRPTWLKEIEGKSAPALPADAKWIGSPVTPEQWKGHVAVLQFFSPSGASSMKQLADVAALAPEFAPQGVVIMGVCDSRANWATAKAALDAQKVAVPVMQDLAVAGVAGSEQIIKSGAWATALGVRIAPNIVVIDASGKVRAAGIRPDKVKRLINTILSEQVVADPVSTLSVPTNTP